MSADLRQLSRSATSIWLQGARLPLTVVENVMRPKDPAAWPPALAFAQLEVLVKEGVGRLTGDDVLLGAARLQRTELERRGSSATKEADAEAKREAAEERAERRRTELERQREAADERAAVREQQLEQDRIDAERAAERKAAAEAEAVDELAARRQKAIDDRALRAERTRLAAEAKALQAKQRSAAASDEAAELDAAVKASKAARKAAAGR